MVDGSNVANQIRAPRRIIAEEPALDRFDLESRQMTLVRRLDGKPFAWQIGLSISSDERMAAISLINQHLGDILMVRDWK